MKTPENIFGEPPENRLSKAARLLRELQLRREAMAQEGREPDVLDMLLQVSAQPFPEVPAGERGTRSIATYYTAAGRLVLTAVGPYLRVVTADLAEGVLNEWHPAADSDDGGTQLTDEQDNRLRLYMSNEGPMLENADGSSESLKPFSELLKEADRIILTVAQGSPGSRTA